MTEEPETLGEPLKGTPYRLLRLLGEGAHGKVYLAEHVELGTRLVIKLILDRYVARAELVSRLRREAKLLARIEHPALVEIRDLGKAADGRTFFVMTWIGGTSVREALRERGSFPVPQACTLMIEAL
ncbi:MAG: hypothetical protein NVS3B20_21920 [Polyangiales bacterium]